MAPTTHFFLTSPRTTTTNSRSTDSTSTSTEVILAPTILALHPAPSRRLLVPHTLPARPRRLHHRQHRYQHYPSSEFPSSLPSSPALASLSDADRHRRLRLASPTTAQGSRQRAEFACCGGPYGHLAPSSSLSPSSSSSALAGRARDLGGTRAAPTSCAVSR